MSDQAMPSQQTYEIQDPNGNVFEIMMDHPPTPQEARTAVAKFRALAPGVPRMAPTSNNDPVTLGDLFDNPQLAVQRMGHLLKNDLTDPKTWAAVAASFVAPRVIPAIGRGAVKLGSAAMDINPDVVGMASPRLGNVLRTAQKARDVMSRPAATEATTGPSSAQSVTAQSSLDVTRAAREAYRSSAAQPAAPAPTTEPAPAPSPAPARTRTPRSAPPAETTPSASAGGQAFELTPEETRMAHQWSQQGIPVDVIAKRIVLSRQLTKATGAPSPDAVRQAVAQRNATGKWED